MRASHARRLRHDAQIAVTNTDAVSRVSFFWGFRCGRKSRVAASKVSPPTPTIYFTVLANNAWKVEVSTAPSQASLPPSSPSLTHSPTRSLDGIPALSRILLCRRGNSILSFGRGRASATSATTAASGSTPPEESTSPEPGSAEADVRTPDQVRLIEQLVERTACDAGIASMALEASLWDLEAAAVLQSKLVEADAELEREQKELFRQEVEL